MCTMKRLFKMQTDHIYFITHTHKIMRQNDRVICAHFYFAVQNCYYGTAAVNVDHIGYDAYSDWARESDVVRNSFVVIANIRFKNLFSLLV